LSGCRPDVEHGVVKKATLKKNSKNRGENNLREKIETIRRIKQRYNKNEQEIKSLKKHEIAPAMNENKNGVADGTRGGRDIGPRGQADQGGGEGEHSVVGHKQVPFTVSALLNSQLVGS